MDLTHEAIDRILQLGDTASDVIDIEGQAYSRSTLTPIRPLKVLTPATLELSTLSGFDGYITENPDGLDLDDYVIHIESPRSVALVSKVLGENPTRSVPIRAALPSSFGKFPFGHWLEQEALVIRLQTDFTQSKDFEDVAKVVAGAKIETLRKNEDDGLSQTVTVKAGAATLSTIGIKNPVEMAPFITFPEVDQPTGLYILRLQETRGAIEFALFAETSGSNELKAIAAVAGWLGVANDVRIIR